MLEWFTVIRWVPYNRSRHRDPPIIHYGPPYKYPESVNLRFIIFPHRRAHQTIIGEKTEGYILTFCRMNTNVTWASEALAEKAVPGIYRLRINKKLIIILQDKCRSCWSMLHMNYNCLAFHQKGPKDRRCYKKEKTSHLAVWPSLSFTQPCKKKIRTIHGIIKIGQNLT